jgi:hypothetical protein
VAIRKPAAVEVAAMGVPNSSAETNWPVAGTGPTAPASSGA